MQVSLRGEWMCAAVFLQSPRTDFGFCFWVVSYKHLFFIFFSPGKLFNILLPSNIFAAVNLWTARLWMQASLSWHHNDLSPCNNSYLWHTVPTVPLLRNSGNSETAVAFKPKSTNGRGVGHPGGRLTRLVKGKMESGPVFNEKICSKRIQRLRSEKKIWSCHFDNEVTLVTPCLTYIFCLWCEFRKNGSHNTQVSLVSGWITDGWGAATGGGTHTHLGLTASGWFSIHAWQPSGVKLGHAWAESPPAAACEACWMPVTNDIRAKASLSGSHTWNVFESKDAKLQTFQVQRCSRFTAKLGRAMARLREKSELSAAVMTDTGSFMLLIQPSFQSYFQNIK